MAEPVAIVGMACTLPGGCATPETFHTFLLARKCGIREIPEDRWAIDAFYDPNPDAIAKSVSKWAGFIDDVRGFDAKFFDISPREAQGMDPQQRLVLQAAVDAMQDSGIPFETFSRQSTGVFIGVAQSEYRTLQEMRLTGSEAFAGTGYALCINANRVSHRLNLHGPSYAVDTACSSSLVALNQAIGNLHTGTCDLALVGGVNAIAHPSPFVAFSKAGMISPTGRISTFDAAANGFVRGEGVGMVVLKPLSRALADGDRIHAVIRGTASNQDGATTTITAPSQRAQIDMLRKLFEATDVDPGSVGFVEAHGTGTPVGDPIETGAIGTVIGRAATDRAVWVGSGKANVGHLEAGAGITGLIKATMAVKTGVVPPNINFATPNPYIPFDALNLRVPTRPEAFPETGAPRRAVVNSFGFGGTNACALVEAAPPVSHAHHPVPAAALAPPVAAEGTFPVMVPISGATAEAVGANARGLLKALGRGGCLSGVGLLELAAALATRRSHLRHRAVILCRTERELKQALRRLAAGEEDVPGVVRGQTRARGKVCFTFSGQGSQWWGMARDLLTRDRVFAEAVDAYDAHFRAIAGWSIKAELLKHEAASRIDDTTVTQPALFAIQSGLAAVWRRFGVAPDMVVGHSIGEAAAAWLAGGLSLAGAAAFLSKRGTIRDRLGAKGAMAAIGLPAEDVAQLLPEDGRLCIAAINGPGSTTISGDHDALADFVEEFRMRYPDSFIRELRVDTAWHSHHLDAGEAWFRAEMTAIDWSVPRIPFISTVTAQPETRFDTEYGWQNLRRPVNFKGAVETAIDLGATTFLELGPAATLAGPTRSTALDRGANVTVLASLDRKASDFDAVARTAARLFVVGHPLDWPAITGTPRQPVELPRYAWGAEPFWQDSEESRGRLHYRITHPFLGQREYGNGTSYTSEVNLRAYPYLKDHCLQADVIFPAAGYIETLVAVCRQMAGPAKVIEIEDAVLHEALFIAAEDEVLISTVYDPERGRLRLFTRLRDGGDDWVLRCEARVRLIDAEPPRARPFDPMRAGFEAASRDYVYNEAAMARTINYGPAFKTIEQLWLGRSKSIARLALQDVARQGAERFHLHPTLLDGCLQVLQPRMTQQRHRTGVRADDPICLPFGAGRMRVYGDFPPEIFVEATQLKGRVTDDSTGAFTVRDVEGRVLMEVEQLRVRVLPAAPLPTGTAEVRPQVVRQVLARLPDEAPGPARDGTWILLDAGIAADDRLARALAASGATVERVARAALGEDTAGALIDLLADRIAAGALAGIVVAWPLAAAGIAAEASTDALFATLEGLARDMTALGDLLDFARGGERGLPEVVVLTSGAYPVPPEDSGTAAILTQMPMAAMLRGIATETPEYRMRVIDADAAAAEPLAQRILAPSEETEMILHEGAVFAPRLVRAAPGDFEPRLLEIPACDETTNFHVSMRKPGMIDDVALFETPLRPRGPGEVSVRVAAVGLNFRDIMAVTGLLPAEAEPEPAWQNLGLEFAGVVEAVGDGVTGLRPGDRVMGFGKRCLQRVLTTPAAAVARVPEGVALTEAATVPSAFATAHYALNHVGRMRQGDKVFIHVATGGVGMAAVQLAQAAGAEIFATAGNPDKRRLLREMGVPHVMDSRSLKFADDVMRITGGRGVDILLNSLPGDYIHKGLQIMAPYGRFLEIGKRDVYEDSAIGMKALRRNVSLSVLDLAAMGEERPDLMAGLFEELSAMLSDGTLRPLPVTGFPVSQAAAALRYMSQARHVGKVVVTFDEPRFAVRRDEGRPVALYPEASILVTGGTAGFGLAMADWLSRAGAGRLVLASRSGRTDAAGDRAVARMRARGTEVAVVALDVTDTAAVEAFVETEARADKPLRGVVHAAAVIQDAFLNQMTPGMIHAVLAPKIKGAWTLHRAFGRAGIEPDLFCGFSSISQVLGSAGQSNYIVGNAFLDALAHYRRSCGQHGVAIDWGVIGDAGFVSRNANLASYLESVGMHGLTAKDTGAAMELAIAREAPSFVYARADWAQVVRANPALGSSPRLASVLDGTGTRSPGVRKRLMQLEGDQLVEAAQEFIASEVANVLKIDAARIQVERPMSELGLDSLSSFELKIRIETALDTVLPVSKFLQAPSIAELSQMLAREVETARRAEAAAIAAGAAAGDGGAVKAPRSALRPSNAQAGLLAAATARLTSDAARRAMEHVRDIALADPVTPADLDRALRRLRRRHPLLDMALDADGELSLSGPGPRVGDGSTDDLLDLAGGETLRLSRLPDGRLRLRMHRVLGDAASARIFADELLALLQGDELPRPAPRGRVLATLAAAGFDAEDDAGKTDRAFWWYALADGAAPVPFPRRSQPLLPVGAGLARGPAAHLEGRAAASDEAGLLMAFAAALRSVTDSEGAVLVARPLSLRGELQARPAIGPFEILQPIRVPAPGAAPGEVANLRRLLDRACMHRAFDGHAAAREFAEPFAAWGVTPFQVAMERCARLDPEAPAATLHDVWLQVAEAGGGVVFRLVYDRDVVEVPMAEAIARSFEAALAAAGPQAEPVASPELMTG